MPRTVSVLEAKTQLSKLLREVENGEGVVITRHGKPVARLVGAGLSDDRGAQWRAWLKGMERLRGSLVLAPGETVMDFIREGRRY